MSQVYGKLQIHAEKFQATFVNLMFRVVSARKMKKKKLFLEKVNSLTVHTRGSIYLGDVGVLENFLLGKLSYNFSV